jgi:hypothetical protein
VSSRRLRAALAVLLVGFLLLGTACQWFQNEFFTLDRARPSAPPEPGVSPW